MGRQTCSVPEGSAEHAVGSAPTGAHAAAEQLAHWPTLLQHARQNAMFGFAPSAAQTRQPWHQFEASQRSPVAPVGVQRPLWQTYPGAQSAAAVAAVH